MEDKKEPSALEEVEAVSKIVVNTVKDLSEEIHYATGLGAGLFLVILAVGLCIFMVLFI